MSEFLEKVERVLQLIDVGIEDLPSTATLVEFSRLWSPDEAKELADRRYAFEQAKHALKILRHELIHGSLPEVEYSPRGKR